VAGRPLGCRLRAARRLVPSIFSSNGKWGGVVWVLSGFVQVGRKRESRKNTGEQTSSSMPLCVKGKKKKSVVQNGTVVFFKKKKKRK
jgi:hypothetical protein